MAVKGVAAGKGRGRKLFYIKRKKGREVVAKISSK